MRRLNRKIRQLCIFCLLCWALPQSQNVFGRRERVVTFTKIGHFGRLGNQLFQIASTIGLAEQHGYEWRFPPHISDCSAGKLFGLKGHLDAEKEMLVPYEELSQSFYDVQFPPTAFDQVLDLFGYFQSYLYFNNSLKSLRKYLQFPKSVAGIVLKKYPKVRSPFSVTLHVRRGDYLKFNSIYNLMEYEYYIEGLKYLGAVEAVLIVSDDIQWCKDILGPRLPYAVVYSDLDDELQEFVLLMLSQKLIVANSTFSWWAAYIKWIFFANEKHNTQMAHTVAPRNWFNGTGPLSHLNGPHLCPPGWHCI
jgi:hypothetical protein